MMTPVSWKGVRRVADRGTASLRSVANDLKPGANILG
jgi:hypothetical protein